ncbi:glycosyltransferase [Rathayibacter sp. VKM Ac-2856]|uniref:glycosyltransferase n=1 Tax=unclassified Rathayibacter TaxID=2609250 RepID=UPI0015636396|nr:MULTISPECIES: glycosyltransferase [unclassified Rathayibacter]NQX06063.1 glycosyltransferase [Rathayibacter sp. VKM Ac-2858]NQX20987.1 glycosyltransferase [Rathayibacter sp. VKM Ac-2856]
MTTYSDQRPVTDPVTDRVTVLHVCERFGGGLADAISSFAAADSGIRHVLLYAASPEVPLPTSAQEIFDEIIELPAGHLARVLAVRAAVHRTRAPILHSHSAFAGLYARLALSRHSAAQVHSPHCFPFERADRGPSTLRAFHLIEWILARNTSLFVTCSENELARAHDLGAAPAAWVVNTANHVPEQFIRDSNGYSAITAIKDLNAPPRVVGVGRVAPQKGTDIFSEAVRTLIAEGVLARFRWIGRGNSEELTRDLEDSGVEVTGWLPKEVGLNALADADVYVHTARWEGFPVSLLEAVAIGVPIVVLRRPYAATLPDELLVEEHELAGRIALLLEDCDLRRRNVDLARAALASHIPARQREQLQDAYLSLVRPESRRGAATTPAPAHHFRAAKAR